MPIFLEVTYRDSLGKAEKRIAEMVACSKSGLIKMRALDYKQPGEFILTPNDKFPWRSFFLKLRVLWYLAKPQDLKKPPEIPEAFRLQRRLDDSILEEMEQLPEHELPKVFAALRKAGYFKPLPEKI